MPQVINISAYKFAPLKDLKPLRERLTAICRDGDLKGTILLSTEGVNLFVAGLKNNIDQLVQELRSVPGLESLDPKISISEDQPFTRMLVKIKKEIIAFGVEGIDPAQRTSPKLKPAELKKWLDEKRPITLLDTRNDFEVKLGTFANAIAIGIDHFRDFPAAVAKLPNELKTQPIVMFCTGGIRCEKAGPYMEREGFEHIYQLDGGILKYFEECGGQHYSGECFVFDKRVGLDPSLHESGKTTCFACLRPLDDLDLLDSRYREGISCPHCYKSSEEQLAIELQAHRDALIKATTPLPGGTPYENIRPLNVPRAYSNQTLLDFLCGILGHIPRDQWQHACDQGLLLDSKKQPAVANRVVHEGERFYHKISAATEPDVSTDIRILYEDEALIVLHKPAPLPIHPSGRFNRNTLQSFLREAYFPQKPRPAHRLDANTTGIVIFTRTAHFAHAVQSQFERGEVEKQYLARVQGHPKEDRFICDAPIRDSAGLAGSRGIDLEAGLPSRTEFKVIKRFADQTTLLEVIPRTGRTNQIRVHLWHLNFPICGDTIYLPMGRVGEVQTIAIDSDPLCLHAQRLTITHPVSKQKVTYEADTPEWAVCCEGR